MNATASAAGDACPCGSGLALAECCGAYLQGTARPATALALMRSRYTAYALGDEAYLLASWHPKTRPAALDLGADPCVWENLQILSCQAGGADDREGVVEFVAVYSRDGTRRSLHESSRFVRVEGEWSYLEGRIKPGKPGRNDPCPCGSGVKHKKCCGR